jgi:hypothetical protein
MTHWMMFTLATSKFWKRKKKRTEAKIAVATKLLFHVWTPSSDTFGAGVFKVYNNTRQNHDW